MGNKTITSGLEDYIEAIYIAEIENRPMKGADLARKLNISRASVSEALGKLVNKGLIQYESYGTVSLTKSGKTEAQEVYKKHNILKKFFIEVLDIEESEAEENACKIEHIISENILDGISKLMNSTLLNKKCPEGKKPPSGDCL